MKPEILSSGLLLNTMVDDKEKAINITVGNEKLQCWLQESIVILCFYSYYRFFLSARPVNVGD